MYSIRDIRLASVEALLELSQRDGDERTFDELWKDAAIILSPGCNRLGIHHVAEFGSIGQAPVPDDLAGQLLGKTYQAGLEVDYQGKRCVVTFLSIMPPASRSQRELESVFSRLNYYSIEEGKMIPRDARISCLTLASLDQL